MCFCTPYVSLGELEYYTKEDKLFLGPRFFCIDLRVSEAHYNILANLSSRTVVFQVSHHPMVVACHCEGRGWKFWADSNLKGKFWGRSIQLDPVGVLTLQFEDGETFQWSKVTTSIYNIILGKIYCDHYGTMRIKGSGNYSCKLKFKEQSIIDRNPHQVIPLGVSEHNNKIHFFSLFLSTFICQQKKLFKL